MIFWSPLIPIGIGEPSVSFGTGKRIKGKKEEKRENVAVNGR